MLNSSSKKAEFSSGTMISKLLKEVTQRKIPLEQSLQKKGNRLPRKAGETEKTAKNSMNIKSNIYSFTKLKRGLLDETYRNRACRANLQQRQVIGCASINSAKTKNKENLGLRREESKERRFITKMRPDKTPPPKRIAPSKSEYFPQQNQEKSVLSKDSETEFSLCLRKETSYVKIPVQPNPMRRRTIGIDIKGPILRKESETTIRSNSRTKQDIYYIKNYEKDEEYLLPKRMRKRTQTMTNSIRIDSRAGTPEPSRAIHRRITTKQKSMASNLKRIVDLSSYVNIVINVKEEPSKITCHLSDLNSAPEEQELDLKDFRIIGKKLGEGAYAIVRPAINLRTGEKIALKTYNKLKIVDSRKKDAVENEIKVLKLVRHPNVAGVSHVMENRRNIHLVLDYAGSNNLKVAIQKKLIGYEVKMRVFKEIVTAVQYLHSIDIVHRDIKLENIVLNTLFSSKLVDFGFAVVVTNSKLSDICGTPNYMSPQLCKRIDYDPKASDVWALGVVLYTLMRGKFPFKSKSEADLYSKICECSPSYKFIETPIARDLLEKIFTYSEARRLTCTEILAHGFFATKIENN